MTDYYFFRRGPVDSHTNSCISSPTESREIEQYLKHIAVAILVVCAFFPRALPLPTMYACGPRPPRVGNHFLPFLNVVRKFFKYFAPEEYLNISNFRDVLFILFCRSRFRRLGADRCITFASFGLDASFSYFCESLGCNFLDYYMPLFPFFTR